MEGKKWIEFREKKKIKYYIIIMKELNRPDGANQNQ